MLKNIDKKATTNQLKCYFYTIIKLIKEYAL